MKESSFLSSLVTSEHSGVNLQVVFTDIVKYSQRKTTVQKKVIDTFTEITKRALHSLGQKYLSYTQDKDLNFATDIMRLPTGDGLAVVFPFEGLERLHLDFSLLLLAEVHNHNEECERFTREGWCNCHDNFCVRVGVAEGKAIVYRDINGNINVAGNPINIASRIMGLAGRMQLMLSGEAYRALIDMTTDTALEENFREFRDIEVKHGLKLDVYQYCSTDDFLNTDEPQDLVLQSKIHGMMEQLMPGLDLRSLSEENKTEIMTEYASSMETMLNKLRELKHKDD